MLEHWSKYVKISVEENNFDNILDEDERIAFKNIIEKIYLANQVTTPGKKVEEPAIGGDKFEIHVADYDITGGSIPISWCIKRELIEKLEFKNTVCIVVRPVNNPASETRFIAPLSDGVAYVTFNEPGPHEIAAEIMTAYCGNQMKNFGYEGYSYSFFKHENRSEYLSKNDDFQAKMMEVNVPEAMFAAAPPKWEKAWVMWLMESKITDQCSYRKRRLFAYTIQPFIFLANMFVRVCTFIISLLLFSKGITFKYLLHPLTYDLGNSYSVDTAIGALTMIPYIYSKKYFWVPVVVYALEVLAILTLIFSFKSALILIGSVIGIIVVMFVLAMIFSGSPHSKEVKPEEVEYLICSPEKPRAKKNSIKLFYLDLKSKVCKPFAGGIK